MRKATEVTAHQKESASGERGASAVKTLA
ncbi:MAG: hypothetical protein ACD_87C00138G0003, partial [uncultured bacterium]